MREDRKEIILGLWFNDRKYAKLPKLHLKGIKTKRIFSIKEALACNFILHKIFDLDIEINESELKLLKAHNGIIDPIEQVKVLSDRRKMIEKVTGFLKESNLAQFPPTLEIAAATTYPEDFFPAIAKPLSACSDPHSHTLHLVYSPEQFSQLPLAPSNYILQKFIRHSRLLIKAYVVGESLDLIMKASIGLDCFSEEEAVLFDSQSLKGLETPGSGVEMIGRERYEEIYGMAMQIREFLGLELFGLDFIIEELSNAIYLVDVNYFPGYSGVEDLSGKISKMLSLKILNK
jgi:hypothetical protein